ncbi:MAG: NAD(P)/FAD-dependent oxidoreductase [Halodesulfurarchaeum sp.]
MEQVDVAIVGGGPGGSAAGRAAALNGADAVVFERGVPRADRDQLGPDSTDAAGFLDYWVDLAGLDPEAMPDGVIQQVLDAAEFIGPSESLTLRETGIDASYPHFGFTFHRARFDDWLRDRAEAAGAEYRVGTGVRDVEVQRDGSVTHRLTLADGSEVEAGALILADGPQRQQTMPVLDQFLPEGAKVSERLSPRSANHVAYQEYRRFPEEAFEPRTLKFWWGWIPGHTAYPWVFPNRDRIGRVGLTMPIGMRRADLERPTDYALIHEEDEDLPSPRVYIRRLLERVYGDEYDIESDFPLVTRGHGKDDGTETYAISSTRPLESPTELSIAVVGGAMGATSAFHEGGDHLALRTGALAGELAAKDSLPEYNRAWQAAVGDEIRRNVALAELVRGYQPGDWDRVFSIGQRMLRRQNGAIPALGAALSTGIPALKLYGAYRWERFRYRNGRVCQIHESDYRIE